jgi:hypothetical protein
VVIERTLNYAMILSLYQAGGDVGVGVCTVVRRYLNVLEPEPQEPQLFVAAEPEPECIPDPIPEPALDPDPTWNTNVKRSKITGQLSGKKCCF